jgi:hypothetical protein
MEGTMLSVFEAVARAMSSENNDSVLSYLQAAVESAREEVWRSPDKLPVLKKAGVVDSGALGFVFMLEGMKRRLNGEDIDVEDERAYRFEPDASVSIEDIIHVENRYCTELMVRQDPATPPNGLEEYLNAVGDSVAFLQKDGLIKLHVHTNSPDEVVKKLSAYGEIVSRKIEDMKKQIEEEAKFFRHENEIGMLALVPGEGFRSVLHEFEPDLDVLVYQKNLPKTGDILNHIEQMPYEDVIVLANEKNIIPAVQLAKKKSSKHVEIFPSKNIIQGVAAVMGFVKNLSWKENLAQMTESMELTDSISVYKSVKDSNFAGIQIPLGHYFAVMNGDVLSVDRVLRKAVLTAIEAADPEMRINVSFYYNGKVRPDTLEDIRGVLSERYEDMEIEIRRGGQHTALLLIGLE